MKDIIHRSSGNIFLDLGFPAVEAQTVSDTTSKKLLLIESPAFKDRNRLLVHDSEATFDASIEDKEFFGRINAGDRFGKRDALVVDLRQIQSILGAKLVNEPIIVKV